MNQSKSNNEGYDYLFKIVLIGTLFYLKNTYFMHL